MNIQTVLKEMIPFLVLFPSAVLCYLPMKHQLRFPARKLFFLIAAALCLYIPIAAWCKVVFAMDANFILVPSLILFYVGYHFTVKTDISRSLCTFVVSSVLSGFLANFAYTFDAWLHPDSTSDQFSWQAGLFQFGITIVICLLFAVPLQKWGSRLIDRMIFPNVWYSMLAVSIIFFLLNLTIIPRKYATLYVGRCFPIYLTILLVLFLFMIFLYISFYHTAMESLHMAELNERIQFFELEESQYLMQKTYIEETAKQRHDFRQSIFSLRQLADEQDWQAVQHYLSEYANTFPQTEIIHFCKNNAVNALLNHYAQAAAAHSIQICWNVDLPETLTITEPDLCSLLGNLIENALTGCMTLEDADLRYHCLSVECKNAVNLYIVSTNSFDGFVRMKDGQYQSTKRKGSGIGVHSAKMIAQKYNGTAKFHHQGKEFYADILLKIPEKEETV